METELGEQLTVDAWCYKCQAEDWKCWVYSKLGAQQIARAGDSCTTCRAWARIGGCSVSSSAGKSVKRSRSGGFHVPEPDYLAPLKLRGPLPLHVLLETQTMEQTPI
jgi:hypothetical protein